LCVILVTQMLNNSQSLIPFQWDQRTTSEYILLVEPNCGELSSCTELCCELSISATGPGNIDEDLVCHLGQVDETVSVHVSAVVKNNELKVDEAELEFGMIRFGERGTRTLTIRNPGRSRIDWNIQLCPSVTSEVDVEEFEFCPSSGIVWPLEMCVVEVTVHPKQCRSLNTLLALVSADGDKTVIGVTADIQHPQVCLLKSSVHIDAYLDVATPFTATLFNQTALSATFEWGEVACSGTAGVDVDVEPKSGVIEARQTVAVTVSITPHTVKPIRCLIMPCSIQGMAAPLNLSVTADVYELGVNVTYSVSSDRESWLTGDGILIDFGGNNLLHETPKLYLRIQNSSGIATQFRLAMESFPSAVTADKLKEKPGCQNGPARLLKKTANLADPRAKTGAKAVKELRAKILSGGSGVAFHLNSSSGDLKPFSEVIIEIAAFADLWGFYSDRLQCSVGNLDPVSIPVLMSIVDSPILFQMISHDPSLKPIVRFGCVVEGTGAVTRRTRILNKSPVDIRIDWQMFNVSADDQQLLDLVDVYGDAFPLKDKNGKEIVLHGDDVGGNLTEDEVKQSPVNEAALDELAAARPQLISLSLRKHRGKEATAPYSIEPPQLVSTIVSLSSIIS